MTHGIHQVDNIGPTADVILCYSWYGPRYDPYPKYPKELSGCTKVAITFLWPWRFAVQLLKPQMPKSEKAFSILHPDMTFRKECPNAQTPNPPKCGTGAGQSPDAKGAESHRCHVEHWGCADADHGWNLESSHLTSRITQSLVAVLKILGQAPLASSVWARSRAPTSNYHQIGQCWLCFAWVNDGEQSTSADTPKLPREENSLGEDVQTDVWCWELCASFGFSI